MEYAPQSPFCFGKERKKGVLLGLSANRQKPKHMTFPGRKPELEGCGRIDGFSFSFDTGTEGRDTFASKTRRPDLVWGPSSPCRAQGLLGKSVPPKRGQLVRPAVSEEAASRSECLTQNAGTWSSWLGREAPRAAASPMSPAGDGPAVAWMCLGPLPLICQAKGQLLLLLLGISVLASRGAACGAPGDHPEQ